MSTFLFVVFGLLVAASLLAPFLIEKFSPVKVGLKKFLAWIPAPVFFVLMFLQTAMYVENDSRGIVTTKFGSPLKDGHVVAFNGERGPQAWTLSPGWNFGLWPWQYELQQNKNMPIPTGKVGLIVAKDGKSLRGQAYADEWDSVEELLDGMKFGEEGFAGPQMTVVPAGKTVAYNPHLFEVTLVDAMVIEQDECVVIKSNHGDLPEDGSSLVPKGNIGIWDTAYGPGTHYLNTNALEPIHVKTVKRVYSYTDRSELGQSDRPEHNHSIGVKTMDGYKFPVDVRVEVIVTKKNAPFVVSQIGPPDLDLDGDGFDNLETRVILPSLRSIFRNNAEHKNALDYLNSRSEVEKDATEKFRADLEEFKVEVIAVRIADIGLDDTPEGKELLKTQTDQELAKQQIKAFQEQKLAAEAEKDKIDAATAATEQAKLRQSEIGIEVGKNEGEAIAATAEGEAKAIKAKIEAYGGYEYYLIGQAIEALKNNWDGKFNPQVIVSGSESGLSTTVLSKLAQDMVEKSTPKVEDK